MIKQIAIRGFDNNFSYFLGDSQTKEIAILDPGDTDHLIAAINHEDFIPKMVLITHSHFDHTEGIPAMLEEYDLPVFVHENAKGRLNIPEEKIHYLKDLEEISIGNLKVDVIYTPGHIDDAVCFYIKSENSEDGVGKLITGDTVFVEGCGRADLENSNVEDLYKSLEKIKTMPLDTIIYPGHNYGSSPTSTIGKELKRNKYFLCNDFEEFKKLRLPNS